MFSTTESFPSSLGERYLECGYTGRGREIADPGTMEGAEGKAEEGACSNEQKMLLFRKGNKTKTFIELDA